MDDGMIHITEIADILKILRDFHNSLFSREQDDIYKISTGLNIKNI